MPLVSMRQILDHAAENNYCVPAFNINDMEQILAVMNAAKKVNAPVILQTSTGARKFAGDPMIRHMVAAAIEMYPELPLHASFCSLLLPQSLLKATLPTRYTYERS